MFITIWLLFVCGNGIIQYIPMYVQGQMWVWNKCVVNHRIVCMKSACFLLSKLSVLSFSAIVSCPRLSPPLVIAVLLHITTLCRALQTFLFTLLPNSFVKHFRFDSTPGISALSWNVQFCFEHVVSILSASLLSALLEKTWNSCHFL